VSSYLKGLCIHLSDAANFMDIIQVLFTIVGFGFAYWLINYRDKLLRRRDNEQRMHDLQGWFEETYIINGVELILAYISNIIMTDEIKINLKRNYVGFGRGSKDIHEPEFPMPALNRTWKLLNHVIVKELVFKIRFFAYCSFNLKTTDHVRDNLEVELTDLVKFVENSFSHLIISLRLMRISNKELTFEKSQEIDSIRDTYQKKFQDVVKSLDRAISFTSLD